MDLKEFKTKVDEFLEENNMSGAALAKSVGFSSAVL